MSEEQKQTKPKRKLHIGMQKLTTNDEIDEDELLKD